MSARLAPSTVAHVLRLVGSSYLETGAGPSSSLQRVGRHVRTARRFASSSHALKEERHEPVQPFVQTPRRPVYNRPRMKAVPKSARMPKEVYNILFARETPSALKLQYAFDEFEANPTALLPLQRLQALYNIYSRPDTTREDWSWLVDTLGMAKDVFNDWESLPGAEAGLRALLGLAHAHIADWDAAAARTAKALSLSYKTSPSSSHLPQLVADCAHDFTRLALRAGQIDAVASAIRYSGPKLHKLLSSHATTLGAPMHTERMRTAMQAALAEMEDPLQWVLSILRPDTLDKASVYHFAIAVLSSLLASPTPRLAEAFAYWKGVTQRFNSTLIPPHVTSLLALRLANANYHASAQIVLDAMHESTASLSHTVLSRELWIYADQGKTEETQRIWEDLTMRYSPTRRDKINFANAYAVSGDVPRTRDALTSLLGPGVTSDVDTLAVLQRACIAAGDIDGAYEYMELSVALRPTLAPYQSMLNVLAKEANIDVAVDLFSRMVASGVEIDGKAYATLISAFANVAQYASARHVFDAMVAAGHQPDEVSYSALINAAVEAGQWQVAADLAEEVPHELLGSPQLVTIILKALVLVAAPHESVMRLFRNLAHPSPQAWALAIQSSADNGNLAFARSLFNDMDSRSHLDSFAEAPNVYVFSILLAAYLRSGDRDSARAVYDAMIARTLVPTSITYGIITTSFATLPGESSFEQAHNFAMSVYNQIGEGERTGARGKAGENILGPLLVAAGRSGDLARAKHYYDIIRQSGVSSLSLDTKLMDAYRRVGRVKSVYRLWLRVFRSAQRTIPRRDPTTTLSIHRSQNNVLCAPLSVTIQALAEAGLHQRLKRLWIDVRSAGFGRDSENYNHYAVALAKTGDVEGAFHIVDRVLIPREEEIRERYYQGLRETPNLLPVEADSEPSSKLDPEDHKDFDHWDPWRQAEALENKATEETEQSTEPLTSEDAADPGHRPPNRRHIFHPPAPPAFTDETIPQSSATTVGLSILRKWRPSDIMWRPTNATVMVLEQAYRQLEDQRAYRAWIGLGLGEEETVDEEPPAVTLSEFGATVKNLDGTDKRLTPKAMIARLNRKYMRVVGLIMLHRRKRAAVEERKVRLNSNFPKS